MKRTHIFLLLLLGAVIVMGCSQSDEFSDEDIITTTVTRESGTKVQTDGSSSASNTPTAASRGDTQASAANRANPQGQPQVQTTMVSDPSLDRLLQNGPTAAQRKRRRYSEKVVRKPQRHKGSDGNGAPVFADEVETVDVSGEPETKKPSTV